MFASSIFAYGREGLKQMPPAERNSRAHLALADGCMLLEGARMVT
jgi:hypothetical protein